MEGCSEPQNLDDFGKPRNFANWPAEFGKNFHGKLWALVISYMCVWLLILAVAHFAVFVLTHRTMKINLIMTDG